MTKFCRHAGSAGCRVHQGAGPRCAVAGIRMLYVAGPGETLGPSGRNTGGRCRVLDRARPSCKHPWSPDVRQPHPPPCCPLCLHGPSRAHPSPRTPLRVAHPPTCPARLSQLCESWQNTSPPNLCVLTSKLGCCCPPYQAGGGSAEIPGGKQDRARGRGKPSTS